MERFEIVSKKSGKTITFEAAYKVILVDDIAYADGYNIPVGKKEQAVESTLRVYVDGNLYDTCSDTSFWKLIDVKGSTAKKVWGLKIGFSDAEDAEAYEQWINKVIEDGITEEVKAYREKANQEKRAAEIEKAKKIIAKAEAQKDIPPKSEAIRRMREYNDIYNEGGEGYVPYIISREEYDAAKAVIAEGR